MLYQVSEISHIGKSTFSLVVLLLVCDVLNAHRGGGNRHDGHTHHIPAKDGPKNVLRDKQYIRDYDHVKEDLQEMYNEDFSEKLDEMELEIFYFQLHDMNNDKRLDGLELLAAMNHVTNRENDIKKEDLENNPAVRSSLQVWWNEKFEEDAQFIDEILKEEDLDNDGYLSYLEFAMGRQKDREGK